MEYTITLSGPTASESQARNALASERFDVHAEGHDYGLPPSTDAQAESFVSVTGSDVDKAWDAVRGLGWRLRIHHASPESTDPTPTEQLADTFADYERRLAALEAQSAVPPIRGGSVESPPFALQSGSYGAEQTRRAIGALLARGSSIGSVAGGIVATGDCLLSPPGSGLSVSVAPGEIFVSGSSSSTQSGYYCRVSSTSSIAIASADPSQPRIDRVSAVVADAAYAGVANTFSVAVETGTPTAGASLVNLNGVAASPASSYTLGYVLVPALSVNVVGGNISNIATPAALGLAQVASGWPKPVARAYRNAAFTPSGGGYQKVPLDTVSYDTGGAGDTAHYFGGSNAQLVTNGNKYIVPSTGYYLVLAQSTLTLTGSEVAATAVFKNGSVVAVGGELGSYGASVGLPVADVISASAGDYLELFLNNPNTSNALVLGAPTSTANYMTVQRVA